MILLLSYSCFEGQQEAFPHQQWASVESNMRLVLPARRLWGWGWIYSPVSYVGKASMGAEDCCSELLGRGTTERLSEPLCSSPSAPLAPGCCLALHPAGEKKKKHISIERDNLVLFKSISEVCNPTSLSDCPVHWTQHLHSSVFSFCCNLLLLLLAAALTTEITAKKINK